jgi:hypothetical protein
MIIAELNGGLGNQLFQYAAAKALSLQKAQALLLGISSYHRSEIPDLEVPRDFALQHFIGVKEQTILDTSADAIKKYPFLIPKKIHKFLPSYKRRVYKEPYFHYDKNFFNASDNVYLKGGWQSEKYFKPYSDQIVNNLQLKRGSLSQSIALFENNMLSTNSVSIHIRRGDYLRKPSILEWHGVLPLSYYQTAIQQLQQQYADLQLFYFSDDPQWVMDELMPKMPGTLISSPDFSQYDDFYLMSRCKHNIIANSSFSWWAAYLNPNPNKTIIAPKNWFNKAPYNTKDLYPEGWFKL